MMPVNLSAVDLAGLIERKAPAVRLGKEYGNGTKRTRKGRCPWCGGTHRFAVFIASDPQRYYCGIHGDGCKAHGDAITFLREYCGMSWREACEELHIEPGEYVSSTTGVRKVTQIARGPSQKWIDQAEAFMQQAHKYLFTSGGKGALDYLISRGFTLETIKHFHLGYCPRWEKQNASLWGLDDQETVTVAEGIVIPSYIEGTLWHLDTRRLRKFKDETPEAFQKRRYHEIPGGVTCLFNADTIEPDRPVIVTEGRIDAMIAWQELRDLAACVATGSAGDSQGAQWAMTLAIASHVIVAFDDDQAGKNAARYWSRVIEGACYYPPYEHDINDMFLAGHDLKEWLTIGLDVLFGEEEEETLLCTACGLSATDVPEDHHFLFADNGLPYCSESCKNLDGVTTPEQVSTLADEVRIVVGRRAVDDEKRLAIETVERLASAGIHLTVESGRVRIDASFEVGEKVKAFVLTYEQELLAWLEKEARMVSDPLNHPVVEVLAAAFNVSDIEILDSIPAYIARRKQDLEQQEVGQHKPALTDVRAIEQEIMQRLQPYGVRMAAKPCSACGCRLEWISAGTVVCSNCEPGGLWTGASLDLLERSCLKS